ncbi:hypothetical protein [Lysobacter gummosus]|uniref:hypothetical protein n=1 Tax=Lysobacter gummosus TaxID=262324 RepID=UPI003629002E
MVSRWSCSRSRPGKSRRSSRPSRALTCFPRRRPRLGNPDDPSKRPGRFPVLWRTQVRHGAPAVPLRPLVLHRALCGWRDRLHTPQ